METKTNCVACKEAEKRSYNAPGTPMMAEGQYDRVYNTFLKRLIKNFENVNANYGINVHRDMGRRYIGVDIITTSGGNREIKMLWHSPIMLIDTLLKSYLVESKQAPVARKIIRTTAESILSKYIVNWGGKVNVSVAV